MRLEDHGWVLNARGLWTHPHYQYLCTEGFAKLMERFAQAIVGEALEAAQAERVAQLIAHRGCCGTEHDPANGKIHGMCVVCGVPWPCAYAGTPPKEFPACGSGEGSCAGGEGTTTEPVRTGDTASVADAAQRIETADSSTVGGTPTMVPVASAADALAVHRAIKDATPCSEDSESGSSLVDGNATSSPSASACSSEHSAPTSASPAADALARRVVEGMVTLERVQGGSSQTTYIEIGPYGFHPQATQEDLSRMHLSILRVSLAVHAAIGHDPRLLGLLKAAREHCEVGSLIGWKDVQLAILACSAIEVPA